MNRIYQGRVSKVEMPFSASDGEKVAKPDEVSSQTESNCRNQNPWQPLGYRLSNIGHSAKPSDEVNTNNTKQL
jgi:hypothetical protein